jgi:glycosyltransferase involved in cell wall biosynthesis
MPEVAGDAAVLVDSTNSEELSEAMCQVLNNDNLRNDLIKKGFERERLFSPEKTSRQTMKVCQ